MDIDSPPPLSRPPVSAAKNGASLFSRPVVVVGGLVHEESAVQPRLPFPVKERKTWV